MSLVEVCHCGHDVTTHFEGKHTCLALCECKTYVHRDDPKPVARSRVSDPPSTPRLARRPHADSSCRCTGCKAYDASFRRW